ncbi:MAG: hypothetical protein WDO73_20805 [Ignavibacteriota bacterium]
MSEAKARRTDALRGARKETAAGLFHCEIVRDGVERMTARRRGSLRLAVEAQRFGAVVAVLIGSRIDRGPVIY